MSKGIIRNVQRIRKQVNKTISAIASNGGRFAGALSSEGYAAGYRDALNDVLLMLNGVNPSRNQWYDDYKP